MSGVRVERLTGERLQALLPDLARLRITVFRAFPYLYDGSLDYEERYLQTYVRAEDSVLVGAFDGDRVIGASTGLPLAHEPPSLTDTFTAHGFDVAKLFYFGELVLLPDYRGQRGRGRVLSRAGGARPCARPLRLGLVLRRGAPGRPSVPTARLRPARRLLAQARLRAGPGHGGLAQLAGRGRGRGDGQAHAVLGQEADMTSRRLRVAAAQYPIDRLDGWQAYADKICRWVAAAVTEGAQLLVFPEYGAMELASLFPEPVPGDLVAQLPAVASLEARVVELHQGLAVDISRGAAAVYGPPDQGFPADGVLAIGELDQPCWVHAEVDLDLVARVRANGMVLNHRHWPEQANPAIAAVATLAV